MTAAKKLETKERLHIRLPAFIDEETIPELRAKYGDLKVAREIVLDFAITVRVDKNFYASMHTLKKELDAAKVPFKSINLHPKMKTQFVDHGTYAFLNYRMLPQKSLLDVAFVQPFIDSTVKVLKVQANTGVSMQSPYLKTTEAAKQIVDIAGVISITSDVFIGTISLCFSKQTFLNICFQLFGERQDEITKETEDAAGEILNMIFSGAKAELNKKKNYGIQKALPTIIQGTDLSVTQSTGTTMVLPFTSDAGPFHIEIELVTKDN